MNRILTLLAAMTLAVGVASADPLPGADVETLLRGKTFQIVYEGGKGSITWHEDLTISMVLEKPDGAMAEDSGTYRFDGKGYCSVWEALAQRTEERCSTIVKTGDTTYDIINPDGSVDSNLTTM
jgi:hypothetical protein